MKFTTTIVAAILAFTAPLISAAPVTARGSNTLYPTTVSQYQVSTGAVDFDTGYGKIFKNGKDSDVTTLVTFDFTSVPAGSTCQLHFYLDSAATVTGSGLFDVFTSLKPADHTTTTWPQGNLRDQYGARVVAVVGGEATLAPGFPNHSSFPCPSGRILGGELVGVYDRDDIEWSESVAGPYITWA